MAGEWSHKRIGDFADVKGGKRLPNGEPLLDLPTAHPYIRLVDIVDHRINAANVKYLRPEIHKQIASYIVSGHDVCLAIVGHTIGLVFYVDQKWHGANLTENAARITNFKGVDPRFLFYVLASSHGLEQIKARAVGSAQGKLPIYSIRDIEVPIPALDEQRAIAHILGTLDDKIELNRRMNETLEAMARALFKSWFVDFDPVRAKAEGRDPGLPKPLADLFPARLVDSELGEIPEGWEIKPIGDLADVVGGTTPSTKESSYWEGGEHAWATPKDLSDLSVPVLLGTERRITDAGLSQVGSGLLPKGTVLLSSRAPIGYLAVAELPVAINQGFIAMVAKAGTSNLFLLLWASVAHEEIVSRANGSTFLEISKANFRPIPLVAPSAQAIFAFEKQARPLYQRIVEAVRESRSLAALRDSLLPRLISGEMRVRGA